MAHINCEMSYNCCANSRGDYNGIVPGFLLAFGLAWRDVMLALTWLCGPLPRMAYLSSPIEEAVLFPHQFQAKRGF